MGKTLASDDHEQLERFEENLWREETRFDHDVITQLFAEDFFEFGRSGSVYQRAESLAVPREPIRAKIPLPDLRIRQLATDVVQITYNSEVEYNGVVQRARRSSIWTRANGRWQLRFHQGTPFSD